MLVSFVTILQTATITLPAIEVCLLLLVLTCCLVFRLSRVGLIGAYLFAYRWGWMVITPLGEKVFIWYMAFGIIVGVLTVIGMLRPSHSDD